MRVAIDADDAALELKRVLVEHLRDKGVEVTDLAYLDTAKADYPDVAFNLARRVQSGEFDRGILLCGTGLGMAMCANKVRGVFAGTCHDVYSAERLRKSNDAQIATMGARVVGTELAKTIIDAWLRSGFQGGNSRAKVARMRELEQESFEGACWQTGERGGASES
jgi:ribose 5-phosphate isomerase B